MAKNKPTAPDAIVVNFYECSCMLGVSTATLERMIMLDEFPKPFFVGKTRRWLKRTVVDWVEKQAAEAAGNSH